LGLPFAAGQCSAGLLCQHANEPTVAQGVGDLVGRHTRQAQLDLGLTTEPVKATVRFVLDIQVIEDPT
jgi:hypothetical protein